MNGDAEWELFTSGAGRAVVQKEIRAAGLSKVESAMLQKMLDRIASGNVLKKDVKTLKAHNLLEARLDGDRRIFRLLFIKRGKGKILVGLYFSAKKSRQLPQNVLETAQPRAADWDSRNTIP
jgi:phage-related protein